MTSVSKTLRIAALSTASLAFAGTAFAGDCSSTKTASSTYVKTANAHQSTVMGATIHNAGYKKKAQKNIVETAVATESLSTLVAAVKAAGLVDTLSSEGPFTVFAPVNDAFAALPAGTVETLLLPENKAKLSGILTAHVVSGKFKAKNIVALAKENGGSVDITTVSGDTLTAILDGDTLFVRDENGGLASVALADVKTSNGVVHVVDKVLLPVQAGS